MVGEVRVGIRRHGQHARLAQQAPAVLIGERHPPEVASVDAGNSVVPGQLFVQERVVRRQQLHDAAVRLQLIVEEQLRFPHEGGPQVVVEPGKFPVRVRRQQPDVARLQPLAEKVVHQRCARARIGEHAPRLLIEDSRIPQFPRIARSSSSSSGMLLHRKNDKREASSTSDRR